jgi:RNA polymerase sigma-70 factor (ECF subfamily)
MPGLRIDLNLYDNEEQLLAALKSGDKDACTCLVKHFAALLYRPALQILGDADEADAAVQNAFMKACAKLDSFNADSRLGTWLYRIATNEALMARRRQASSELILQEDVTELLDAAIEGAFQATAEHDPVTVALTGELHIVLAEAFEQLPETLRQVIFLRTIQGLSTAETATLLEITEGTVKMRLHRARQQLHERLANYLEIS